MFEKNQYIKEEHKKIYFDNVENKSIDLLKIIKRG